MKTVMAQHIIICIIAIKISLFINKITNPNEMALMEILKNHKDKQDISPKRNK